MLISTTSLNGTLEMIVALAKLSFGGGLVSVGVGEGVWVGIGVGEGVWVDVGVGVSVTVGGD
jgi:hypothetical protein